MDKLKKALETINDIELTEEEQKSFDWLLTWENSTVENICSIIEKIKESQTKKKSSQLKVGKNLSLESILGLNKDIVEYYHDYSGFYIKVEGSKYWYDVRTSGSLYLPKDDPNGGYKMIEQNI